MALILAVNPGASQSATLSRLARELQNCELVGADSYATAIKAIDQRAPDLVLLPGTDALAEAELVRRLKQAPRRVATLKLPAPAGLDVKALAADVRAILEPGAVPAPIGTSPHLLAAAAAAVKWIKERREAWLQASDEEPQPAAPDPAQADAPDDADLVARLREAALDVERERERQRRIEEDQPSVLDKAVETADDIRESVTNRMPHLAVAAALLAVVVAGVIYWPSIRDTVSRTVSSRASTAAAERADSTPASAAPAQNTASVPARVAAGDTDPSVPGFIAVFAPFEVSISEGSKPVLLDDQGRAILSPGGHRLRFRNRDVGYDELRTVRIRPTETTTLNLLPKTTLAVTANEPAEVLVNGTSIGRTPVAGHRLDLGTHTITVRGGGSERRFSVDATMKPIYLNVDFSKP